MSLDRDRSAGAHALSQYLGGRMGPPVRRFTLRVALDDGDHDMPMAVRAFTFEERVTAHANAMKFLTGTGGWQREDVVTDGGDTVQYLAQVCELLAVALRDPDDLTRPFASGAASIRQLLTDDQILFCLNELQLHQQERSPFDRAKTWGEVEEMVDALGKGLLSTIKLQRCDRITLLNMLTTLADRAAKRMTARFSDTSPPNESPAASEAPSESTTETVILSVLGT